MEHSNLALARNALRSRDDMRQSLADMLAPLRSRAVPGGYNLGDFAAHYAPKVALMEGFSRTLWGIGPLLAGGGTYPDLETARSLLRAGVDPASPGYWGVPGDRDQRLVEMASIALCLLIARPVFWESLSGKEREQLYAWLSHIERRRLPPTNWHFFRVLVCAAFRELGLPVDENAEQESFDLIESCYVDGGWYKDGPAGNYDFYNPFGFHFYGLLYARLAGGRDPGRAALYAGRARVFAERFTAWFREDGSNIPYGRSLGYRFAPASFFSACAFAADMFPELEETLSWGALRGIVMRNLRQWFSLPVLDSGGILSVGYGYPNQIMADNYNSPGSPYWALKIYLVLALGEAHPFWRAGEAALPEQPPVTAETAPGFIVSHTEEDAALLSPGQNLAFDMAQGAEKYCKFAYSARFGFCVSRSGYSLEMTGCDSMLTLSEDDPGSPDDGVCYWRQRRGVTEAACGPNWTGSVWKPWPDVRIRTVLVSLGGWHVRLHRIESARPLKAVEGGFPLKRYNALDESLPLPELPPGASGALAAFPWGASRIAALEPGCTRTGALVTLSPNLNILYPSAVVPVLKGRLEPGITFWAAAVRAGDCRPVSAALPPSVDPGDAGRIRVLYGDGSVAAEVSFE
jgi:hypothetical protein